MTKKREFQEIVKRQSAVLDAAEIEMMTVVGTFFDTIREQYANLKNVIDATPDKLFQED